MQYDSGGALYELVSSDNADIGMTGWVEGANATYHWVREKFTTNGTTVVPLTTSWYSVYRARLDDATAGQITIRTATGDNTRLIIAAAYGGTLIGAFTVPVDHHGEIYQWTIESTKDAANDVTALVVLLYRTIGGAWTIMDTGEYNTANGRQVHEFAHARILVGPVDLRLHVEECSASNIRMSGTISYALVNREAGYVQVGPTKVGF